MLKLKFKKFNKHAKIVLVTGDRTWEKAPYLITVGHWLRTFEQLQLVITGAAAGVDDLAEQWAKNNEMPYMGFPAKWSEQHKAAGPIRNGLMLEWLSDHIISSRDYDDVFKFDVQVLGFHLNIAESKGTKDMLVSAQKTGYPTYLVDTLYVGENRA